MSSAELLDAADLLVAQDTAARPRPGHVRRAISSAYYALFHELVNEAVQRVAGSDPSRQTERDVMSRWYSHGDLATVATWVIARAEARKIPDPVGPLLSSPAADLVTLAQCFVTLHRARRDADYARAAVLTGEDGRQYIAMSRAAIAQLPGLAGDRGYESYLRLLLGGPRIATR